MNWLTIKEHNYEACPNMFTATVRIVSKLILGNLSYIQKPFFTIVIPTYKRYDSLKEAIASALNQQTNGFDYNVFVVDNDADSDGENIRRMVERFANQKICYYKNAENIGAVGNWNRAIELSTANWVCFLHDDDLLLPNCLQHMYSIITQFGKKGKKEIGYIRANAQVSFDKNLQYEEIKSGRLKKLVSRVIYLQNSVVERTKWNVYLSGGATWAGAPTCGTVINRKVMLEIGGYDQQYSPCPDIFPVYRMLGKYRIYKTSTPLGIYRWGQNDTYNDKTLIGLIEQFYFFLEYLSSKHRIVKFFEEEYYVNQVNWCIKKAKESGKMLKAEDFSYICKYRNRPYRRKLLNCLLVIEKIMANLKAKSYKV